MSVYGKKIVIDGVEYVAVPEVNGCNGCAFASESGRANCQASSKNSDLFLNAFGRPMCFKSHRMILKKVTPKKKPESTGYTYHTNTPLPKVKFKTVGETAYKQELFKADERLQDLNLNKCAQVPIPNMHLRFNGIPYLNPFEMMMDNTTVLIDDTPCKIIDAAGECGGGSIKHVITFEQTPCRSMPVFRCGIDRFIVCLSESGNLKPSETPHQHDSELAAIKEAQRLCKKHNQNFVVLKVVAEVEPEIQTKVTKR